MVKQVRQAPLVLPALSGSMARWHGRGDSTLDEAAVRNYYSPVFNPPLIKSTLQLECRTPADCGVGGGPPPIGPLLMSLGRHIYY